MIHSGDFTNTGMLSEVEDFDNWLGTLPHQHKVVVPGNHDSIMDPVVRKMVKYAELELYDVEEVKKWEELDNDNPLLKNGHVLINRSVLIDGLKFFGSPHTIYNGQLARWVHNRYVYSFGCTDESCIDQEVFQPESQDCDILVTHSPPLGIADISHAHRGSLAVRDAVLKINPALHIFGHVHPYGGNVFKLQDNPKNRETISSAGYSGWWWAGLKTTFVNAASLTLPGLSEYSGRPLPSNMLRQPVVIDINTNTKHVVC